MLDASDDGKAFTKRIICSNEPNDLEYSCKRVTNGLYNLCFPSCLNCEKTSGSIMSHLIGHIAFYRNR